MNGDLSDRLAAIDAAQTTVILRTGVWTGTNGAMKMNAVGVWLSGAEKDCFYPWHQVLEINREAIK